ncbi:MAG: Phenylalanine--tRNA ligase beta subunit [Candidatus Heimdallarchaeota archaeon LC_3]|uniref:phenylalanine--tRNA ligase n=1 Tax=uncultured organism TaxID=155900 RepID=A0A0F6PX60_9ZZZZ|nr:putative phenylalanine-tRNA ligase beta subunit [uncultured organism]OLS22825.1 MAG: Phenylalanine--tRNA ligase beta subunit [Candidatus Heimdallarchaeota archaeon LC_3]
MPTYQFSLEDFNRLIPGKPVTLDEIKEEFPYFGVPFEGISDEGNVSIEVFANRPDNLSVEGLARSYAGFSERKLGLPEYKVEETEPFNVFISENMKKYRPYLAMAKVTGLQLDEETVKAIFTFQEKLHITHCRNRRKTSIGLYDINAGKLEAPISLRMAKMDELRFIPLEEEEEMTIGEMFERSPKGREYAYLVPKDQAPVLIDKKNQILSVVPILNGNNSRLTKDTKNIFVDCTGTDWDTMISAFNMILTSLAERGGKIHPAILHYEYETPRGTIVKLPNFTPKKYLLDPNFVVKKLGRDISVAEQIKNLEKMRLGAKLKSKGKGNKIIEVSVPAYRTDILHQIDFVEEIAIAYNYKNFTPTIPKVVTTGKESPWQILKRKMAYLYTGVGAYECMTYMLTSEDKEFVKMGLSIPQKDIVKISNPITTLTTICRHWLTPSLIETLKRNKKFPYPQKFFEMGKVTYIDKSSETGTEDVWKFCFVESSNEVNLNNGKSALATMEFNLGFRFELKPTRKPYLIQGRSADIYFDKENIGYIGEIHPQILNNWALDLPVVSFEINMNKIMIFIKKTIGDI